ncbi:MAG: hypothetical protein ACYC5O_17745 [Anaerolineae bacterium]
MRVHCECGNVIAVPDGFDQVVLSANTLARMTFASNQLLYGTTNVTPGIAETVAFMPPFELPGGVIFTPEAIPLLAHEVNLHQGGMTIISSLMPGIQALPSPVKVNWLVYGLVDLDAQPPWFLHFFGAMCHLQAGMYKPALLDYAIAFEVFLERFLRSSLSHRYDAATADYLLRREWRVEDRAKELLKLATGHSLADSPGIRHAWQTCVQKPRNDLVHGKLRTIGRDEAEKAHQAVWRAIHWIESLRSTGGRSEGESGVGLTTPAV